MLLRLRFSIAACLAGLCLSAACRADGESSADLPTPNAAPIVPPAASFLRPGETVVLRLSYGLITNGGETRFETTPEDSPDGPRLRVKVSTTSKGLVETFYPLRNYSESLIDAVNARPLLITTEGKEGSRTTRQTTVFDYEKGIVEHTDHIRPKRSGTATLPKDPVFDLMVTMMQARTWNMRAGEKRTVVCSFADEFYTLEVTALEEDEIKTPAGKFNVIVLEPKQVGELKGFFKKGGSMKFYISRGKRPQLVRLDMKTKVGTIVAALSEETFADEKASTKP
ncbi:MAG: DUF3108 domain-containing protein [Opitutaceae bacterium]|nr:DUF3108 domain-containing protein [Opitutaceae bacterium]